MGSSAGSQQAPPSQLSLHASFCAGGPRGGGGRCWHLHPLHAPHPAAGRCMQPTALRCKLPPRFQWRLAAPYPHAFPDTMPLQCGCCTPLPCSHVGSSPSRLSLPPPSWCVQLQARPRAPCSPWSSPTCPSSPPHLVSSIWQPLRQAVVGVGSVGLLQHAVCWRRKHRPAGTGCFAGISAPVRRMPPTTR